MDAQLRLSSACIYGKRRAEGKEAVLRRRKKNVALSRITRGELKTSVGYAVVRGGCAGVIVNTVKKAQEIAEELGSAFPESEVILMHAQFIMTERAKRRKRCSTVSEGIRCRKRGAG